VTRVGSARGATNDSAGDVNAGTPPEESLCTACGLCCDGTLFWFARLFRKDDLEAMRALGIVVDESAMRFGLPCPCLEDKRCSVYQTRFVVCRRFECGLLSRVSGGAMPLDEALRLVEFATKLAGQIRWELSRTGISTGVALHSAVTVWRQEHGTDSRLRVNLLFGALEALRQEQFLPRKRGTTTDAGE